MGRLVPIFSGKEAFSWCELREIEILANVEGIGNKWFSACYSLSRVTFMIWSVVKRIGNEMFRKCQNLTEAIKIPASVHVGANCFAEDNERIRFEL